MDWEKFSWFVCGVAVGLCGAYWLAEFAVIVFS